MLLAIIFLLGQLIAPQAATAGVKSTPDAQNTQCKKEGSKKKIDDDQSVEVALKKADEAIANDHLQQLAITIAMATGNGSDVLLGL
jgi:hypothetical protein